jgi:hypothetical protein
VFVKQELRSSQTRLAIRGGYREIWEAVLCTGKWNLHILVIYVKLLYFTQPFIGVHFSTARLYQVRRWVPLWKVLEFMGNDILDYCVNYESGD